MKKIIISSIFLLFVSVYSFGQSDEFKLLIDSAKEEFYKENFEEQNYENAAKYLEKAVILYPNNAEARYFLGYAYSRINSKDGSTMVDSKLPLVKKASEQFEQVIKLTPKYEGEIIALDPYSKIQSEWGTLAMSYLYHNKKDSALWAFNEGKKRGSFSKYILNYCKETLNVCDKNAILLTSGDNLVMPLWYLQEVEKYRTDIALVATSLLNSEWYPKYLLKNNIVSFDMPVDANLDSLGYCEWQDSIITINHFSWTLRPTYYETYLLRGDVILLNILKENDFKREVYFTVGFPKEEQLCLTDYFSSYIVVDKVNHKNEKDLTFEEYYKLANKILNLSKYINPNSTDELRVFDIPQHRILLETYNLLNDKNKAKSLFKLIENKQKKYPFGKEYLNSYFDYLKDVLNSKEN